MPQDQGTETSGAGKTALVTGASGGIGYELAKLLAADGYTVYLVARSADKLAAIARELNESYGATAQVIVQDLAEPEAPERIAAATAGHDLDVLINNAGFGDYGTFADSDWKRERDMIQVNITSLVHLSRLYLPGMVARRRGRILNVASTAAFVPGPFMSVYFASKAFVLSFSEAIAAELERTGVTVTALCPGPTETGFLAAAHMESSKLFQKQVVMNAPEVARIGYEAMHRGEAVSIAGAVNRVATSATRFLPRSLLRQVVYWASKPSL